MENLNLIDYFSEFKELKNINREILIKVLEDVFKNMLEKQFENSDNFDVIINPDKGDFEIWRNREVVKDEDFVNPHLEISLSAAKQIDEDYEVGEEVTDEVKLESFGRRAILSLRQNLSSRILELEKDNIYSLYKDRIGQIVSGEVYQIWKREILIIDDEGNELILPKSEQIPADYFRKGDNVKGVVIRVDMRNGSPLVILSRTSSVFLERLFELEVPEIFDGLITIKKIVRIPGERAKVAVESYDERIDPVGACVGMKGSRIHGIVRELHNENIDVINYTNNLNLYISRALSPAKINRIEVDTETKKAEIYLDPDQVSKAIGRNGLNIKLAIQLTDYDIDVYRDVEEDEDDVNLDEFSDEIESWIIDQFKSVGLDTAKSVLALSIGELEKRTDLEEETIGDVLDILREEFE